VFNVILTAPCARIRMLVLSVIPDIMSKTILNWCVNCVILIVKLVQLYLMYRVIFFEIFTKIIILDANLSTIYLVNNAYSAEQIAKYV